MPLKELKLVVCVKNIRIIQPLFCKLIVVYLIRCTFQPPYMFTYLIFLVKHSFLFFFHTNLITSVDVTTALIFEYVYFFCFSFKMRLSFLKRSLSGKNNKTANAQISQVWRWTPLRLFFLMNKKTLSFRSYITSFNKLIRAQQDALMFGSTDMPR